MTTENTEEKSKYYCPPSEELLELVQKLQQGNLAAQNTLCEYFAGLVIGTARRYIFYSVLGEDAISIGWIIFLECLQRIDLQKTTQLTAGYFEKVLQSRLTNVVEERFKHEEDYLEDLNLTTDDVQQGLDEQIITDIELKATIKALKPKDRELIYLHYFNNLSLVKIAQLKHENPNKYWSAKHRLLPRLRKKYLAIKSYSS